MKLRLGRDIILLMLITLLAGVLRFYNLGNDPPGLYADEVSIGLNAYKILTTGRDEYGVFMPLAFKSYGDYKMPVYIYLTALSEEIFGKNDFAVRFPSAFMGTLSVVVFYFVLNELLLWMDSVFIRKKRVAISLLSAALLATSSWHIQFSRGGFEVNVSLFFYLLGILSAAYFWRKEKLIYLVIWAACFVLSIYAYHTYRILMPVTGTAFVIAFLKYKRRMRKTIFAVSFAGLLLVIPLLLFSLTPEGRERFSATSAFANVQGHGFSTLFDDVAIYLRNYATYFSPVFLFVDGDGIGRHQIPGFGELSLWQLPFLLTGLFFLFRLKRSWGKIILLLFLFLSPGAAALALPSPHALRSLPLVLPLVALCALGMVYLFSMTRKPIYVILTVVIASYSFMIYLHFYYIHYPVVNFYDWGSGYEPLVNTAAKISKNYSHIVVDKNLSHSATYFSFYAPSLSPILAGVEWKKPEDWKDQKVLYIRPFYGQKTGNNLVNNLYIPNPNHDIYAQFWRI